MSYRPLTTVSVLLIAGCAGSFYVKADKESVLNPRVQSFVAEEGGKPEGLILQAGKNRWKPVLEANEDSLLLHVGRYSAMPDPRDTMSVPFDAVQGLRYRMPREINSMGIWGAALGAATVFFVGGAATAIFYVFDKQNQDFKDDWSFWDSNGMSTLSPWVGWGTAALTPVGAVVGWFIGRKVGRERDAERHFKLRTFLGQEDLPEDIPRSESPPEGSGD